MTKGLNSSRAVSYTHLDVYKRQTWDLASHLSEKQCAALVYPPFTPQWPACLDRKRPIMDQVTAGGDVLLSLSLIHI